jgi:hypothetical protein
MGISIILQSKIDEAFSLTSQYKARPDHHGRPRCIMRQGYLPGATVDIKGLNGLYHLAR